MTLPRIAVILTGGTIESVGRDRRDLAWYIENKVRLSDEEVVARVPELHELAQVEIVPFRKLPSPALTDRDWLELVALIHELTGDGGVDGVVITHGTNTLEETAYFLHLCLKTDRPVVLVGAMRPASAMSTDVDLNLLNAVAVAGSSQARGQGVLVVLNDTIFSARDVTKSATYRVQAFTARDTGPLGYADGDGQIVFAHTPVRAHTLATEFDVQGLDGLPRVDVIASYVGADGAMIDAAVRAGARGLVSAATGAGRLTPAEDRAFDAARAAGVAVCIGSRVGSGRVVRSPGSVARGFVAAGDLLPWKARILLALGLTRTTDPDDLQRLFNTY